MSAPPMATARPAPGPGRPAAGHGTGWLPAVKERVRQLAHRALDPTVRGLVAIGARPNHVTVLGALLSVAAGVAFFFGVSQIGALLLVASGLCDILDGQLARRVGGNTKFGAFLDSTLDRMAEAAVLLGLMGFYIRNLCILVFQETTVQEQVAIGLDPTTWAVMAFIAALALVASFLVSYTRARAEGLGLECKVGWFERPERIVLLILAGLIHRFWAMSAALLLLTILSSWTAVQRIRHVWAMTRPSARDRSEA